MLASGPQHVDTLAHAVGSTPDAARGRLRRLQAAGKVVDKRSDLWSFGVVLLEMLTAQPVFTGETVSHVLASVLKNEPEWSALPAGTPPLVRRLLRRCLEKDRKRRLDSASVAKLEIEEAMIETLLGDDEQPLFRRFRQSPGLKDFTFFEHEIPVQDRMIVFENHKSRHGLLVCRSVANAMVVGHVGNVPHGKRGRIVS